MQKAVVSRIGRLVVAVSLLISATIAVAASSGAPSARSTPPKTAAPAAKTNGIGGGGGDPGDGNPSAPTYFEQGVLNRSGETVEALGPTLMGDSINEYSGTLEFTHTDVSLPGNSALAVAVGRHLATGARPRGSTVTGNFGDWDLDIPHLHTVTTANGTWWGDSWTSPNGNRCSQMEPPPNGTANGSRQYTVLPAAYWDGYHMYIPGGGDQTMLSRAQAPGNPPAHTIQPTDGGVYPVLTKQNWQFTCLSSLDNGTGEGFLAHAPDGTTYQFDHLLARSYPGFKVAQGATLYRSEIWILPTQVTDRFGNWVHYTYGGDGWQLMSITASDGRGITFTYSGSSHLIQSINDGTRTWTYAYDGNGTLQTVTLPDASQWQYALTGLEFNPYSAPDPDCSDEVVWDPTVYTGTVTHPSGAVGSFNLQMTLHGRSNVPGTQATCSTALASRYFSNYAIASKTLSGPGMPSMTWSYGYPSDVSGSYAPCNGCVATETVTITDPKGDVTQNTYGTRFGIDEGLLISSAVGVSGGSALSTTAYGYLASNAGPYPALLGYNAGYTDSMSTIQTPQNSRVIYQQGVYFTQSLSGFDSYARPSVAAKSSSLGYSKTETTAYADNTNRWILGQVASQTVGGIVASRTNHDATTALPTVSYKFEKLQATYGFNADGTLSSIADGLNQATTFSNYMRGLPQTIAFADNTSMSAVVNNIGVMTSVTNEAGTTWNFGYDAMGRLASKTPPGGDPVSYNPTSISFVQVPSAEYGIDANHWRQTITTGNAATVNYFDGRLRKRLTITYDAANPGATQRMQRFDYDAYNRPTFAAYPARSISSITASTPGTSTAYDALGRVLQQSQDSELGTLTSSTAYLASFQKQVTNPRGYVTTTAYQVYDEPSESAIATISEPEGVNVTITRDAFSKPTSIYRGGNANGYSASATRSYVYDAYQLLCKTVEPEVGATIQSLDAANNVAWRATGLNLTSISSCDTASVPAANMAAFTYDARNRSTGTGFGDGSPSIGRSYTPDGLVSTVVSGGTTWNYYYNNRRVLYQEKMYFPVGGYWITQRGYDANSHQNSLTYADGSTVSFSPNALGEVTQVGSYATGVTYYPNGAVAGYTLGNGIAHAMTQNTRGLPSVNQDAGVMQDQYTYDANGNITAIEDQQEGISSRSMGYDGLDRLTTANAPGVWGSGSYSYDPLDNMRTSVVGSRSSVQNYNATSNRLDTINTNGIYTGYAYDTQGNVTGRGTQGFYFDQGNRMQSANGIASYAYDGLGRRVLAYGADGTNTFQMYSQDGQLLIRQPQGGAANNSYTLYFYLAGKTIAEYNNISGASYLHVDSLGSPIARSDASGALIGRTRYEPYGNTAAGAVPTDIGFTGHANDADTGLVYMQQRYYDPIAGRFQSVDPIISDANTGGLFNRYEYVDSNPYKKIDPDGRVTAYPLEIIQINGSAKGPSVSKPQTTTSTVQTAPGSLDGAQLALGNSAIYRPLDIGDGGGGGSSIGGPSGGSGGGGFRGFGGVTKAPDFVVAPDGTAYPVPAGARALEPVINPGGKQTGVAYTGGSGGANKQVDTMRLMNPTPARGNSPAYPQGYIKYENKNGQGVEPSTGRTLPNAQSHYPIH